jgi:hypothetical protein
VPEQEALRRRPSEGLRLVGRDDIMNSKVVCALGTALMLVAPAFAQQPPPYQAPPPQYQQAPPQYDAPPPPPAPAMEDKLAQLKELGELKEAGVLTELEFAQQKDRILNG